MSNSQVSGFRLPVKNDYVAHTFPNPLLPDQMTTIVGKVERTRNYLALSAHCCFDMVLSDNTRRCLNVPISEYGTTWYFVSVDQVRDMIGTIVAPVAQVAPVVSTIATVPFTKAKKHVTVSTVAPNAPNAPLKKRQRIESDHSSVNSDDDKPMIKRVKAVKTIEAVKAVKAVKAIETVKAVKTIEAVKVVKDVGNSSKSDCTYAARIIALEVACRDFESRLTDMERVQMHHGNDIKVVKSNVRVAATKIIGRFTDVKMMAFEALPKHEKVKYLTSTNMTGVINPNTKRVMCAKYKDLEQPCMSKSLKDIAVSNTALNSINNTYISGDGIYVSFALLGTRELRTINAKDTWNVLKSSSICKHCRENYSNKNECLDILHRAEVCALCKIARMSTVINRNDTGKMPVCQDCTKFGDIGVSNREFMLSKTLDILAKIFPKHNLTMGSNHTVTVEGGTHRHIDYFIRGEFKGHYFIILIEKDENQHESYVANDEKAKTIGQTNAMMQGMPFGRHPCHVLVIRYNPNGDWIDYDNGPTTGPTAIPVRKSHFNTIHRLIILRQWIIWYLMNVTNIRELCLWYMWYNAPRKSKLYGSNFDGFAMLYSPPAPPSNVDWAWCADPNEAIKLYFKPMHESAVNVDEALNYRWRLDARTQTGVARFPSGIVAPAPAVANVQ